MAAKYGHLNLLKLGGCTGCTWSETTCTSAANADRLDILQWARAGGCPRAVNTYTVAAHLGFERVHVWATLNRCLEGERVGSERGLGADVFCLPSTQVSVQVICSSMLRLQ